MGIAKPKHLSEPLKPIPILTHSPNPTQIPKMYGICPTLSKSGYPSTYLNPYKTQPSTIQVTLTLISLVSQPHNPLSP